MQFNVTAPTANPLVSIPDNLVDVNPIPEPSANLSRTLTFTPQTMGPNQLNGHFLINGTGFNMSVINYTIPLNNTEIWTISNQSAIAHPFHIHDVQFFVLDRNGQVPPPSEQGRKDVILVKAMESLRLIMKFEDFANQDVPYMYHCHMLVHEDAGMMGQFKVVDNTTDILENQDNISKPTIYPNPAGNNSLFIESDEQILFFEVLNLSGVKLIEGKVDNSWQIIKIDNLDLPSGIYIIKLRMQGSVYTEKLMIN